MALIAAHLNAGIIVVVTTAGVATGVYNLPLPLPPSLISLMVSVDVRHHVYLLYILKRFTRMPCESYGVDNSSLCCSSVWYAFRALIDSLVC